MSISDAIFKRLELPFRLDVRALALLRIGTGGLLLLDLLFRLPDLQAHYSDQGLFPLKELFTHSWQPFRFSLHTATGMWQGQLLLFVAAAAAAFALAFGWRTRLATFLSWLLILSLHNRNPFVLQGGDDLLRILLFWGMFMPWGKRWSVDANNSAVTDQKTGPEVYAGAAGAGYILLLFSVYFFSALMKTGAEWTSEYTALYYALSLDQIRLPLGDLLYPHFELMRSLTFVTWWAELLLPILLLLPTKSYLPRLVFIAGMALLHLGISASLYVGLFFVIGWVTLLGLLPPFIMDRIEKRAKLGALTFRNRFSQYKLPAWAAKAENTHYRKQPVLEGLLWAAVVYCLFWNLNNTPNSPVGLPSRMQWIGQVLRLDQYWGMFAPEVFKDDGWYIFEGKTADGTLINIREGGVPVDYTKPKSIVSMYSSDRWRKYSEYYLFMNFGFLRPPHCEWALREWNKNNELQVQHLDVVYMKEVSLPGYKVFGPNREVLCSCGSAVNFPELPRLKNLGK